jgi:hypothetical protein
MVVQNLGMEGGRETGKQDKPKWKMPCNHSSHVKRRPEPICVRIPTPSCVRCNKSFKTIIHVVLELRVVVMMVLVVVVMYR